MANPAAPHGLNPVAYLNGAPWTGKANLYHIQSTDTIAYYIGDIMQAVTATANGSTVGSDNNGVPNVTGFPLGASVTAYGASGGAGVGAFLGPIIGIQVAPIGTGAGNPQNNNVNLNLMSVPATKTQDYYVWIADDPNLIFEIQGSASLNVTKSSAVESNATFLPTAPATTFGPVSATVVDTLVTAAAAPLKVVQIPYRVNVSFGINMPLLVKFNTHFYNVVSGTTGQ
jgi:hypothetical protein